MAKNILNNGVVHHVRNMMTTWFKRTLLSVTVPSLFGASRLLKGEPHLSPSRSCQKGLGQDIKLNQYSLVKPYGDFREKLYA